VEFWAWFRQPLPRRANHIRAQLLVQASSRKSDATFPARLATAIIYECNKELRYSLDIDPLEF